MAKHIPLRMCIGCRCMRPKQSLIKIVASGEGLAVDERQKLFGRGAYICRESACIEAAKKKKALQRVFKRPVQDAFYEHLKEWADG